MDAIVMEVCWKGELKNAPLLQLLTAILQSAGCATKLCTPTRPILARLHVC